MEDLKTAKAEDFLGRIIRSGSAKYLVTEIIEEGGLMVRVRVEEIGGSFKTTVVARDIKGKLGYTFLEPGQPKEPKYEIY